MSARNLDLYINLARPSEGALLAGRRDLTMGEPPVFIDGEKPNVRIQFLLPSATPGESPEVTQLEDGDAVVFALKKKAGATLLVTGTGFGLVGAGNERRYEALVNFDTTALVNAFGDETALSMIGEVRVQNAANTERKTFQFRCTVRRRVYDNETDPVAAEPQYPAPESVLTNGTDTAVFKRGVKNLVAGDYANVAVAFVTAFSQAPTTFRVWLMKKAGAPIITAHENHDTITAAGATVDLANPIPDDAAEGDYKLGWLAIL